MGNEAVTDTTAAEFNSSTLDRKGASYATRGAYAYIFVNGICTDTVRLHLTINTPSETDTLVTACQTFTWDRTGQTYNTSGSYDYTFVNGTCVDTIRLQLTIGDRKSVV